MLLPEPRRPTLAAHVTAADGTTNYRLRIEHAQVTTPEQILASRILSVIASMQPSHLLTDMNWAESRLGAKRAETSYAWAEFFVTESCSPSAPIIPSNP